MTFKHPQLRILMTADTIGGVWTFSLDLMSELANSGVEFALATMGRELNPVQRDEIAALPNVHLFESRYKLEWMDDPWEDVHQAGKWLLGVAEKFQPDVIHLNGYVHATLPWEKPVLVAAHSCVYSWFNAVKGIPPPRPAWTNYHQFVRSGLEAAQTVTAPTREMLRQLRVHYGNSHPCSRVVYNGRDSRLFRAQKKEPFIFTGGRLWDEAKNIRILDRAAQGLPWPILVAGDGNHPNGGTSTFPNLHPLGMLSTSDFAARLSQASIYALPARYEPFGLSALEAALSGCALVLSDIPTLREIWQDAALFVSPNDEAGWRRVLAQLIEQPILRTQLSNRAWRRAQKFTARKMANGYLAAYKSILQPTEQTDANHSLLSFTPVRLEPRKRTLPPGLRRRAARPRA